MKADEIRELEYAIDEITEIAEWLRAGLLSRCGMKFAQRKLFIHSEPTACRPDSAIGASAKHFIE